MTGKRSKLHRLLKKVAVLTAGSLIAAVGLELFLVPNFITDGGVVGISIVSSFVTDVPLGVLIFILNMPFLIYGHTKLGKKFILSTLFSVTVLSVGVTALHSIPVITSDTFLASVFGGIILGTGMGLVIQNGGSLDGTEIMAIILSKRTGFSVGEIVLFLNLFILSGSGLIFGWDMAMYSLLTYFIAIKVVDKLLSDDSGKQKM